MNHILTTKLILKQVFTLQKTQEQPASTLDPFLLFPPLSPQSFGTQRNSGKMNSVGGLSVTQESHREVKLCNFALNRSF